MPKPETRQGQIVVEELFRAEVHRRRLGEPEFRWLDQVTEFPVRVTVGANCYGPFPFLRKALDDGERTTLAELVRKYAAPRYEFATCGRCRHEGTHFGVAMSRPLPCLSRSCTCTDWLPDECPGSLGQATKGQCPGGPAAFHAPECPDLS